MGTALWFVTDGADVLSVFDNRRDAERDLSRYQDDPDFDYYECYSIEADDLVDYPDEYEIALDRGLID